MRTWIIVMVAVLVMPAVCLAETFVLTGGTEVEGEILRMTQDGKVTLKTKKGISVYHVFEFSEDTRTEHFKEFEKELVERRIAVAEAAKVAARNRRKVLKRSVKRSSNAKGEMPKPSKALVGTGVVLCVIGGLWMIIAGFAVSPIWGIAFILSCSIAQLAFIFVHWDEAKQPFLMQVVGIALLIGGMLFAG